MKVRWMVLVLAATGLTPSAAGAQRSADAYLDEDARELVRLARVRRSTVDRRIEAYGTTARERMSIGLRARIAEKLLYRRETVTRIAWARDGPVRLEVVGAREVAPPIKTEAQVPFEIDQYVPHLAFDPGDPEVLVRFDTTVVRHPLLEGSEAHYRFESGDTTAIRLPDGRSVRLRELRVLPRRRDPHLVNGSFWLETETHAVVRAYFKLARAYDAERDAKDDGPPGFLKPARADLDFIALEYGLWELEWWLPRLVAAQGVLQAGPIRVPLSYERTYDAYTVRGDTSTAVVAADTAAHRPCPPRGQFALAISGGGIHISPGAVSIGPASDSAWQAYVDSLRVRRERERADSARVRAERRAAGDTGADGEECDREVIVTAGADSVLLNSPELPQSAYGEGVELIAAEELRALVDRVRSISEAPWRLGWPRFQWGFRGPRLVRYNRVEGVSLGGRLLFDLGRAMLETEARLGIADRDPRGEIAFDRQGNLAHSRIAAYRRLQPATSAGAELGVLASVGALLFGRDDVDYFDAVGGELVVRPPESRPQHYDLRIYAERQRAVERNTGFSIAHLIDSDREFRANFKANRAEQFGARLRLRAAFGRNPAAPQLAGELSLGGETGDYRFVRPEALVRAGAPLPFGLALGAEGAAGTVEGGDIPVQALWRVGGASTLRGYPGSSLVGERYWRARVELGRGMPATRLTLFGDAAWAGPRNRFDSEGALFSAGAGASLLDGLVRIDLARGFRRPGGWRLHVRFNGVL